MRVLRRGSRALPEGPVWLPETEELLWVDIPGRAVVRSAWDGPVDGSADRVLDFEHPVGFAFASAAGYLVGTGTEVLETDAEGSTLRRLAALELPDPMRVNDAAPDPDGRLVFGTMDPLKQDRRAGVYRVGAAGGLHALAAGFTISNGIGWSPDGAVVYLVDSFRRTIFSAPYHGDGALRLTEFAVDPDGQPDGLAVDAEGCLWVASYGGGAVKRYDPAGRMVERLETPADRPAGVAFAGPGLGSLVVTLAGEGERELVVAFEVATPGMPVPEPVG